MCMGLSVSSVIVEHAKLLRLLNMPITAHATQCTCMRSDVVRRASGQEILIIESHGAGKQHLWWRIEVQDCPNFSFPFCSVLRVVSQGTHALIPWAIGLLSDGCQSLFGSWNFIQYEHQMLPAIKY